MQYLLSQADIEAETLLCLAQLGDHLGLSTLEGGAIDALIQQPWVDDMISTAQILELPKFQQDPAKVNTLLHHPNRGAYTELQVLELLEMAHVAEDVVASILKMDAMQTSELDTLLGILVNKEPIPDMLLGKAVQQYRLSKGSRPSPGWSTYLRILPNVTMPDTGVTDEIDIIGTDVYLQLDHSETQEDGEDIDCVGYAWHWTCMSRQHWR